MASSIALMLHTFKRLKNHVWIINGTLIDTTAPGQWELGSYINEGVLHIPKSPWLKLHNQRVSCHIRDIRWRESFFSEEMYSTVPVDLVVGLLGTLFIYSDNLPRWDFTFPRCQKVKHKWYDTGQCIALNIHVDSRFLDQSIATMGCPRGIMVKVMDCGIVISEFELHSRYYFLTNTSGKVWTSLYSQLWVK